MATKEEDTNLSGQSYQSKWVECEMILNAIGDILDGEEPSDFELSYPIVRKVYDLKFGGIE